ncbi:BrnA antitoxin family protein [Sphingomonas sp. PvP056]|uniref:BrnA antitoxin family protein n=1 Tax=Sphingomonas sp. PvP056 TaxID=3156392 RepID=UPI0033920E3A
MPSAVCISRRGRTCESSSLTRRSDPALGLFVWEAKSLRSFRADGPGWQTRINEAVREAISL